MTRVLRPKLDTLPTAQRQLWPELRSAAALGFVLYGGTAVALHLGHRPSVDFDFFTDQPLDRARLHTAFPFVARSTVLQDQPDAFTILVTDQRLPDQDVSLSFFGSIGFGRVDEPNVTDDGVVQVASLADLMATMVKVLLQRVEAKDYRDIAAMILAGVSLEHGLAAARAMYGPNFQPSESLKALVYFEGGDLDTLAPDEKNTLIQAVRGVRELPHVVIAARSLALPVNRSRPG